MNTVLKIGLGVAGNLIFAYTGYFLWQNSKPDPVVYETELVTRRTITSKIVANGTIVPSKEVNIKPHMSGIIEELYVEPGQVINAGQLIAKIKVVPNMIEINAAESKVETARINLELAQKEFKRQLPLFKEKVISDQEFQKVSRELKLQNELFQSAVSNLELLEQGMSKRHGKNSNLIYSTIDGMILDIPVKSGSSVIERNNFNEGTTIATIANMNQLVFEGKVDEADIRKIKPGMPVKLTIGAIPDKTFDLILDYIAPKGTVENGAVYFLISASFLLDNKEFIQAGLSANADIILSEKQNALAIKEGAIQFASDSVFVEVESKEKQVFKKRLVKTGISDGIYIQVFSGVMENEHVKIPTNKL